ASRRRPHPRARRRRHGRGGAGGGEEVLRFGRRAHGGDAAAAADRRRRAARRAAGGRRERRADPMTASPFIALRLLVAVLFALVVTSVQAALPIEHWTTSNGARVYFVRADTIPMLDLRIDFDAGARLDPPGRTGLASLTAAMLARGVDGADETQISEAFARIGALRSA